VLAPIAGRSVLAHCVERLTVSGLPVVVATTSRPEDDAVAAEGGRLGAIVLRGPDEDVLARYVLAAAQLHLDAVVRATADNPAVDMEAPARVLATLDRTGADHVEEVNLPCGAAVEAVAARALFRAESLAAEPYDREHVTPFFKRDGRTVSVRVAAPPHLSRPELRLTVDTSDDLQFVQRVFELAERSHRPPVPLEQLIRAAVEVSRRAPMTS
jgi:spore coat polysaccharide biosynthesis protein SpsF (cytidylyltransferase family)